MEKGENSPVRLQAASSITITKGNATQRCMRLRNANLRREEIKPPPVLVPHTPALTFIAVVIHEDDLLQQVGWRVIDSTVHRPQDDRERFVDEDEDNGDLGQVLAVLQLFAPAAQRGKKETRLAERAAALSAGNTFDVQHLRHSTGSSAWYFSCLGVTSPALNRKRWQHHRASSWLTKAGCKQLAQLRLCLHVHMSTAARTEEAFPI